MYSTLLKIGVVVLIGLNAALAVVLAQGEAAGLSRMTMLLVAALAAFVGAVLGAPTVLGISSVAPARETNLLKDTAHRSAVLAREGRGPGEAATVAVREASDPNAHPLGNGLG